MPNGEADPTNAVRDQLNYLEELAIRQLELLEEIECTHTETRNIYDIPNSDTLNFPVRGVERCFKTTSDVDGAQLWHLGSVFHDLAESFRLLDELQEDPTYEKAMELALTVMQAAENATDVVLTLEPWWTTGKKSHDHLDNIRNKRNANYKKLQEQYQPAVDAEMANGEGYSQALEIVADIFGVTARTVRIKQHLF